MKNLPLISIVVPSYNQRAFIAETLQSLIDQEYPNLEVIIQDGQSTDGAIEVAQDFATRFPAVFKLFVEKDSGQADALNRGFARTKGEILGFLNSDDTLYPGCLHSVAAAIDPQRQRYIVFGRCLFTGEGSPYVGVEHPAEHPSQFEFLAIWKRGYNILPQPSVFWHRRVWDRCGGFNAEEHHVLDYDLFCRFGQRFAFHRVDELWSTYRMHAVSKSSQRTESEILDMSIAVSRRYWGGWWSPLRWRCEVSHWLHNRHLHEHARHFARQAEEFGREGRTLLALKAFFQTLVYSPRMARDRLLRAWLSARKLRLLERLLTPDEGFTGQHGDGWIGPVYRTTLQLPENATQLTCVLKHLPQGHHQSVECELRLNGKKYATAQLSAETDFLLSAKLDKVRRPSCEIEIRCSGYFVPRDVHNTPDDRKLSVQLLETTLS